MMSVPNAARNLFHALVATISGLFIAAAVAFGIVALAVAGLLIGAVGALTSHMRPRRREAVVTLNATRTGRGWIVDPNN